MSTERIEPHFDPSKFSLVVRKLVVNCNGVDCPADRTSEAIERFSGSEVIRSNLVRVKFDIGVRCGIGTAKRRHKLGGVELLGRIRRHSFGRLPSTLQQNRNGPQVCLKQSMLL